MTPRDHMSDFGLGGYSKYISGAACVGNVKVPIV
jgi:hypothetical protein